MPLLWRAVTNLFSKVKPASILETGTYTGRGSTYNFWRIAKELGFPTKIATCEINPAFIREAKSYFREIGADNIEVWQGLSISKDKLPSAEDLQANFVDNVVPGIHYDHDVELRVACYIAEVQHPGIDNLMPMMWAESKKRRMWSSRRKMEVPPSAV